jgi:hypothetical protein
MRKSTWTKELSVTGSQSTVTAKIVATMNYRSEPYVRHNHSTHENYQATRNIHKIEVFIDGKFWDKIQDLFTETQVTQSFKLCIERARTYITRLANESQPKTFADHMNDLIKD